MMLGNKVNYFFVRQKNLAGVGDAVLCAEKLIKDDPFAIMFPDDLIKSKIGCLSSMIQVFNDTTSSVVAVEKVLKKDVSKYGIVTCKTKQDKVSEISSIVKPISIKNPNRAVPKAVANTINAVVKAFIDPICLTP